MYCPRFGTVVKGERELLSQLIKQNLLRAQQMMKAQADKNKTEREFQEGDSVFLKLQPYVQSTVADRTTQKLSFRFYGPYKILQRVGKVAYKLDLLPGVHPVVHVSQLKKQVPPAVGVSNDLSSVSIDPLQPRVPVKVLKHRMVIRGATIIWQVLIQWEGWPESMATWEDEHWIKKKFPNILA
jgi:hypothetical protein